MVGGGVRKDIFSPSVKYLGRIASHSRSDCDYAIFDRRAFLLYSPNTEKISKYRKQRCITFLVPTSFLQSLDKNTGNANNRKPVRVRFAVRLLPPRTVVNAPSSRRGALSRRHLNNFRSADKR